MCARFPLAKPPNSCEFTLKSYGRGQRPGGCQARRSVVRGCSSRRTLPPIFAPFILVLGKRCK